LNGNMNPERAIAVKHVRCREVIIRVATREDRDKLVKFYEALSVESVYNRFMGIIRFFDPYVDRLLSERKSVVVVAEDKREGLIVGVAEAVGDEEAAESGIAVLEAYQRAGLGTELARALVLEARKAGFKKLYGYVLRDNIAALRLARKFGAVIKQRYPDMIRLEISLY